MSQLPRGPFGVIYADPPWSFRSWSLKGKGRSPDGLVAKGNGLAERHYPCMTTKEIGKLPIRSVADDNCALFLWTTSPLFPESLSVIEAWGFRYKTIAFVWAKTTRNSVPTWAPRWHYGLGYWTRANAEYCLLATRGKPKRLSKSEPQLIVAPVREHSRKPEEARQRIERMMPGRRLELFARERVPGWEAWGLETDRFVARLAA